jgi:transcriptional regulator with XRE-family HTH domain
MGVTPQQVNKIVKGNQNLTLDTITKLQDILGISILISHIEHSNQSKLVYKLYEAKSDNWIFVNYPFGPFTTVPNNVIETLEEQTAKLENIYNKRAMGLLSLVVNSKIAVEEFVESKDFTRITYIADEMKSKLSEHYG